MAKYDVTHSCGHQVEHQLYGPHKERDRKIEWLETVPCLDCKRDQEAKEREAASAKAAAANAEYGRHALAGSDKQIAWAETIRLRKLTALAALVDKLDQADDAKLAVIKPVITETYAWASAITDAKWWIDHRDAETTDPSAQLGAALDYMTGRRAVDRSTDADHVRQLLILSPHTTDEAAAALGIQRQWQDHLQRQAAASAAAEKEVKDAERLATKASAIEACRAAGITGRVRVWMNDAKTDKRIYGDGWSYNHTGREAGKINNETSLPDDVLKNLGARLCQAWNNLTIYC